MPLSAAIIGAGALGAVGSTASGLIGASASEKAASQQAAEQQLGLEQQQRMFHTAKNALNPFIQAGTAALPGFSQQLGSLGSSTLAQLLNPGSSASTLSSLPGFKFQSQWGNIATQNALAAQGLGGSAGPLGTALSNYNQGLAGTYWQNDVTGLQNFMNTSLQAQQNFINTGSNAASALAGNAISSGNSQAQTLGNIGNAQASGTLGSANAISGGIQGVTNAAGSATNALLLSKLLQGNSGAGSAIYGGS